MTANLKTLESHFATVQLTVSDTGIGIPSDKQKVIFEAFSQADGSTTRKYGGTGLGLSITARLVEMMGGKIWLESELGHGSRFHVAVEFRLPRGANTSRESAPAELSADCAALADSLQSPVCAV